MSYTAKVYRVLIASPSDVEEEREIAVKTIQEWNDLHSADRQVVLLPLRWETHTAPEYGRRPQEIINRQIVDHCDILIGIFWTRIGSPTGEADSGTLEEIERVASAGKPVMLYFSQVNKDPDLIDLEQLAKLRTFKSKTFPLALVEQYSSQISFRDKLAKQLEMKLRGLIAAERNDAIENRSGTPNINFEFVGSLTGAAAGKSLTVNTVHTRLLNLDKVPDYTPESIEPKGKKKTSVAFIEHEHNKDYYRDLVRYVVAKRVYHTFNFSLENTGLIGARDIYIDLSIKASEKGTLSVANSMKGLTEPSKTGTIDFYWDDAPDETKVLKIEVVNEEVRGQLEISALQPKRCIAIRHRLLMAAKKSVTAIIKAKIYADILPTPITEELKVSYEVQEIEADAFEILADLGINFLLPSEQEQHETDLDPQLNEQMG
ncbi:DUF4062 domain-containing protein [Noviherbaspirillum sedimenti]|uniref:DUF4062 domain-containing protein n=1 Tax=Noviherbaspirillum sedimenti TaxID=2320865 RepID=A0A3A3G805_9BURK|nr:DUF4062 domain-containing protein [Noviherbaspirillum sedimenti]RJG03944.1 DUF4062 domain-containing protein [Noviherbaspirillum sedimenti]